MVLPPESLVADVAGVRPLVRMGSLVDEEVIGLGEVSAAELANELLFRLGGQAAAGRLPVRGQLADARQGRGQSGTQLGELPHLGGVLLRGGHGQVGKVKAGPFLVQCWEDVGDGPLLGVEEVRGKGERGEREAGVHQALRRHLRNGRTGDFMHIGVAQCPVVHVHGLHGAESVQTLQLVHSCGEGVHSLEEGVVSELQGRVQRDGGWQSLASHLLEVGASRRSSWCLCWASDTGRKS